MVLLYMKGPLEQVVTILPIVSRAQVAFQRVAELSERFSSPEPHLLLSEQEAPDKTVDSLELRDVRYSPRRRRQRTVPSGPYQSAYRPR